MIDHQCQSLCLPNEEWRDIAGMEGVYQISSLGRVRSLTRSMSVNDAAGRAYVRTIKSQIIKQKRNRSVFAYPVIKLVVDGKDRFLAVHTLVAAAFIGPRSAGQQVRHLDGDGFNSCAENLAYGTALENAADKSRHGNTVQGERHYRAKISDADVITLRTEVRNGLSRRDAAAKYGVSESQVRNIVLRINRKGAEACQ